MIADIKAIRINQTEMMQKFNSRLTMNNIPGCEKHEYDSYDYWECAMRMLMSAVFHLSGTCKIQEGTRLLSSI
ncbi:hypothetical protein DMN91_001026 [Ooceraea biroi]|nr:hypothetical protein DMN91_001026 [Ooceraea biroi]